MMDLSLRDRSPFGRIILVYHAISCVHSVIFFLPPVPLCTVP